MLKENLHLVVETSLKTIVEPRAFGFITRLLTHLGTVRVAEAVSSVLKYSLFRRMAVVVTLLLSPKPSHLSCDSTR
jgi:hypothetical protein